MTPRPCSGRAAAGAAAGGGGGGDNVRAVKAQLDLMEQDTARVSAPDWATPFASLEDAVDRLLPYHVSAGGWADGLRGAACCLRVARLPSQGVLADWQWAVCLHGAQRSSSSSGSKSSSSSSGGGGSPAASSNAAPSRTHSPRCRLFKRPTPPQMFGAEDPLETDAREVEGMPGDVRLATSRHEAWQDFTMHRVNECAAGLALLQKKVRQAEAEALQRSQLPLLMLQSYATAESQAAVQQERKRRLVAEQEKERARQAAVQAAQQRQLDQQRQQQEAARLAQEQEQQRQQAMLMAQQQQQQQAAAQQQAAQQQAMQAAAAAAQQQQQPMQPPGGMPQMPRPPGFPAPAGMPPGLPPGMQPGMMQQPRPPGMAPPAPAAAAKPLSAADKLAALKARVASTQRK